MGVWSGGFMLIQLMARVMIVFGIECMGLDSFMFDKLK